MITNPLKRISDLEYLECSVRKIVEEILQDIEYHKLPFKAFETGRTIERQKDLVEKGFSKTLESKHIIEFDNLGEIKKKSTAVDFVMNYSTLSGVDIWSWANVGNYFQKSRDMAYYKMFTNFIIEKYQPVIENSKSIEKLVNGGIHWGWDWPHLEFHLTKD